MALAEATFLFRSGRRARLGADGPREFMYGYAELAKDGAPVSMLEEAELGFDSALPRVAEAVAGRIAGLSGIHPRLLRDVIHHRNDLAGGGTLIATTHSMGLALAAARRMGFLAQDIIVLAMGLLRTDASAARRYWLRILLSGTTLATLSKPEAIWLRQVLGPRVRVVDFAFGVDLEYWQPSPAERGGPVLSVGNDWNRDFATLTACWKPEFPVLEIVTSLPVSSDKANVRVIRGDWRSQIISDDDLRARVRRARLVVVPLRDTIQPSGQSAALQAMACGRPVIMSGNRGCWDREMLERHGACRFVPPGDPSALSDAITGLLADPDAAEAMGVRARRMLERENVSSAGMADQFRALIPALGLRR